MFSGLIEHVGVIRAARAGPAGALTVSLPPAWGALPLGSSLAVDGVCLTVIASAAGSASAAIGAETARRSTLGGLAPGAAVNLERPLALGARLDGHLVLGHVDEVGRVARLRREGQTLYLTVAVSPRLVPLVAPQGSLALAGVSLTVVAMERDAALATVALVPHTLAATTLGAYGVGAGINVEADVLARYVQASLAPAPAAAETSRLSASWLAEQGFA